MSNPKYRLEDIFKCCKNLTLCLASASYIFDINVFSCVFENKSWEMRRMRLILYIR